MSLASSVQPTHRFHTSLADMYFWGFSALWVPLLVWQVTVHGNSLLRDVPDLAAWTALIAIVNLIPVPGGYATALAADLPIGTAAALILSPVATGLVSFVGAIDPKEFHRRISLRKALFNRSQISFTGFAVSLVGHWLLRSPASSPLVLPLSYMVLAMIETINMVLITSGLVLERHLAAGEIARKVLPGKSIDQGLTFLAWGALAAMLVALYDAVGTWALLAFLGPTLLGRQMIARSKTFVEAAQAYRTAEKALLEMSNRIKDERTDERRLIAADLHDEVLQPLFKVSLMGEVLRRDLSSGRLLEADEDLPELLSAAEVASNTLRDLIGDLRRSTLGRGGLAPAIESLVRSAANQSGSLIHADVQSVQASGTQELAIYQIAKEALANALGHSRATNVWVSLGQDESGIQLSIHDDGAGFDTQSAKAGHYGIYIMRERAASIGADLFLDSMPGKGCQLTLHLAPLARRS